MARRWSARRQPISAKVRRDEANRELERYERMRRRRAEAVRLAGLYRECGWDARAKRLEQCCAVFGLGYRDNGERAIQPVRHCGLRLCPQCAAWRGGKHAKRFKRIINHWMNAGYAARFLTLTMPSVAVLERDELAGLFAAWNVLRSLPLFQEVVGSLAVLEFTKTENGWHPHLHILILSPASSRGYIAKAAISEAWATITGASIVDIRKTDKRRLSELLKYMVKSADIETADDLREVEGAMHRFKAMRGYGCFYNVELDELDELDDEDDDNGGFHCIALVGADEEGAHRRWLAGEMTDDEARALGARTLAALPKRRPT